MIVKPPARRVRPLEAVTTGRLRGDLIETRRWSVALSSGIDENSRLCVKCLETYHGAPLTERGPMTTNYNLANIRILLLQGFSDRELRDLCIDVDQFRPASHELSESMGKSEIVARLLAFAVRRLRLEDLLIWRKPLTQ